MLNKLRATLRPKTFRRMPSFEAAAAEAGRGYLDREILRATGTEDDRAPSLIDLPEFFGPFFTALSVAALDKPGQPLHVMDFGGATGDYQDYADAMFSGRIPLRWSVVETEMYAEAGKQSEGRRFYTSIEQLHEQPDVAMFSGALQYVKGWREPLTAPAVRSARTVYIARTLMGPSYAPFLQTVEYDGATVRYPGAVLPERELTSLMSETHQMLASWAFEHAYAELGIVRTPAMIWRKRQ